MKRQRCDWVTEDGRRCLLGETQYPHTHVVLPASGDGVDVMVSVTMKGKR